MLLPTTNDSHHIIKSHKTHDEVNTYSHLIRHLSTNKDARKLTILLIINLICAVLEVIYGLLSNSIGLLSDSAHMLFDSTALAVGIYASYKATLPANSKFSYGFDRFQTLSGLINGIFLIFIGFYIFIESLERMYNPPVIHSSKMIVVAVIGLIVNVVGVTFFHEHAHFGEDHEHSGCSHSHKKEEKSHQHSHKSHAKAIGDHTHSHHGHSHSHHHHDHDSVGSIQHIEGSGSIPSTLNSIKEDDHHHNHSHSHSHSHAGCNHGHSNQQPDHHHQHTCNHDEKSHGHSHSHAHEHKHEHKHDHSHDHHEHDHEHEEHDHDHDHGHDHHHNENLYGVFLHILADLLGSVGVITSSILIMLFDWYIADAICSAITSLLILASVVPLIKSSIMVFLQTYPVKYKKSFHQALSEISHHPAVVEFKDAHLWMYTHSKLVCSVVLVVKQGTNDTNAIVEFARKKLKTIKKIEYMTIDCRVEGQI